jgi:hypothetical protein
MEGEGREGRTCPPQYQTEIGAPADVAPFLWSILIGHGGLDGLRSCSNQRTYNGSRKILLLQFVTSRFINRFQLSVVSKLLEPFGYNAAHCVRDRFGYSTKASVCFSVLAIN